MPSIFKGMPLLRTVATALVAPAAMALTAGAQVVDGTINPGEYGAGPTAATIYTPAAPNGNFGSPSPLTDVGYSIYQTSANGFYYGAVQVNTPYATNAPSGIVGTFANLYFDLDPATNPGSDLAFELSPGAQNVFVPAFGGPTAIGGITVASGNGGSTFEFSIPVSFFTSALPGLTYEPGVTFPSAGGQITLRLSQSFGYSVAGGATYGPDRLGSVTLSPAATAAPEPASLALIGTGLLGVALVRRRKQA